MQSGRIEEAQKAVDQTIGVAIKGLELAPSDRTLKQNLIVVYGNKANLHERLNEYPQALAARRVGMQMLVPLVEADPKNATLQAGMAFTQYQIASTLNLMQDYAGAEQLLQVAIATFERLLGQNPAEVRTWGYLLPARRALINALDGMITDAATSSEQRAALRERASKVLAETRAGYENLQKQNLLSPGDADVLQILDRRARELNDDSRIAPRTPPARTQATDAPQ
jgi:hypothetical protein